MLHSRHIVKECYAFHRTQSLTVFYCHLMACLYSRIHLTEVEQTVSRTHLIHLAVDARAYHRNLVCKPEVLQIINALFSLCVMHYQSASLYCIINFRSMETQCRHISCIKDTFSIDFHTESVCSIINHFQSISVGYLLYAFCVARLTIHMHWHYRRCFRCYGGFNPVRVNIACRWVDVNKHRFYAVPPQAVCRCHKTVWRCYHLTCYAQPLQSCYKRKRSVCEKAYIWNFQIGSKLFFQLFVKRAIISNPLACPYLLKHRIEFIKIRQQWRSHRDNFVIHNSKFLFFISLSFYLLLFNMYFTSSNSLNLNSIAPPK